MRDHQCRAIRIRCSSASCTERSDSESSDEVASSRMRIGASLSSARAIAIRLPLAARHPHAQLADHRLVSSRKARDKIVRIRELGGRATSRDRVSDRRCHTRYWRESYRRTETYAE